MEPASEPPISDADADSDRMPRAPLAAPEMGARSLLCDARSASTLVENPKTAGEARPSV